MVVQISQNLNHTNSSRKNGGGALFIISKNSNLSNLVLFIRFIKLIRFLQFISVIRQQSSGDSPSDFVGVRWGVGWGVCGDLSARSAGTLQEPRASKITPSSLQLL